MEFDEAWAKEGAKPPEAEGEAEAEAAGTAVAGALAPPSQERVGQVRQDGRTCR